MKIKGIRKKFYNRLVTITIAAVYLLILAGGIVRSTGSGMGCPDWPKCFGSWVPPTDASQLPANYQEAYALQRVNKNHRLAGHLETFGFKRLAEALRAETLAAPEAEFNQYKTWTEYINRVLGVLVGFLITGMLVTSVAYLNLDPPIFYGSLASFLLVVFQGWIGSVVVSTNLLPGVVTFHMLLAIVMIGLLIYLAYRSQSKNEALSSAMVRFKLIEWLLVVAMGSLLLQIAMGTQVREAIDIIAVQLGSQLRNQWVGNLGNTFYVHRTFSLLILGLHLYLFLLLSRTGNPLFRFWSRALLGLILLEIILGAFMAYFGIPAWTQPIHLVTSTLIMGLQFWLYLKITTEQKR